MDENFFESNKISCLEEEMLSFPKCNKRKKMPNLCDEQSNLNITKNVLKEVKSELEQVERELKETKARMHFELGKVGDELNKKKARLRSTKRLECKLEKIVNEGVFWKMKYEALQAQQESTKVEQGEKYQLLRDEYWQMLGRYNSAVSLKLLREAQSVQDYNEMRAFLTPAEIQALLIDSNDSKPKVYNSKLGFFE